MESASDVFSKRERIDSGKVTLYKLTCCLPSLKQTVPLWSVDPGEVINFLVQISLFVHVRLCNVYELLLGLNFKVFAQVGVIRYLFVWAYCPGAKSIVSDVFKESEGIYSGKGNLVQANMLSSVFKANSPDWFSS